MLIDALFTTLLMLHKTEGKFYLDPAENGMKANAERLAVFSGVNRSGSNICESSFFKLF